jgi:hypothetical protein
VDNNLIKDQIKKQLLAEDGDISDSDEDIDSTLLQRCALQRFASFAEPCPGTTCLRR